MSTITLQQKWDHLSLVQKMASVTGVVQLWLDRHHQRKQLANMEYSQLLDMGLNGEQVAKEINKPFWK